MMDTHFQNVIKAIQHNLDHLQDKSSSVILYCQTAKSYQVKQQGVYRELKYVIIWCHDNMSYFGP